MVDKDMRGRATSLGKRYSTHGAVHGVDAPMGDDELNFGRRARSPTGPKVRMMAGLLSVLALGTWWAARSGRLTPSLDGHDRFIDELVVEVRGSVPKPGFHAVAHPVTVAGALQVAGVDSEDSRPVLPGTRIDWDGRTATLRPMEDTLVVGLPLDLNAATASALEALPGVGPSKAAAILEERNLGGRFQSVEDLERVRGIGPKTVDELRPFVHVESGH